MFHGWTRLSWTLLGNIPCSDSSSAKARPFSPLSPIPAFKKFSYDTGYSNARASTGKVVLAFGPFLWKEELAEPTRDMVKLAEKALADPDKLVGLVAEALWEEFNGRGPTTGTCWYDDMDTVNKSFRAAKLPPPDKPQDILPALQLTAIMIFTQLWKYPRPVVVLDFHAAFEVGHGLCVVTDGERVLGTGYTGEPEIGKGPD